MQDADPARSTGAAKLAGELPVRVASALVLAPLAIGIAYIGGWIFAAFWGGAAILMLREWVMLATGDDRRVVLLVGGISVVLATGFSAADGSSFAGAQGPLMFAAIAAIAAGSMGAMVLTRRQHSIWAAAGIPYAGAVAVAPTVLRSDIQYGFQAIILIFAIVWTTDILAFFIGRTVGGPKLAPRISPKKTWSGAIGGTGAAVAAAVGIACAIGLTGLVPIAILAAVLSVIGQAGDLFESALKRRFRAKDSGQLIPGHGGLMDRLDAFVAAAGLAAIIGVGRGGLEAPARGLLLW